MRNNIAVFGSGNIYKKYRSRLSKEKIIAILDNDVTYHGNYIDGIKTIYPREVFSYEIDKIILMSDSAIEMWEQLNRLGYPMNKVIHYKDYIGCTLPQNELLTSDIGFAQEGTSLLIISNPLGYHGAPIVVLGLVACVVKHGYRVTVATSCGERRFIDEIRLEGAEVILLENLENASDGDLKWAENYDVIIANTLLMARCAIKICNRPRVFLWLHENPDAYFLEKYWWDYLQDRLRSENLKILAVSNRAKENFLRFFNYKSEIEILEPFVPDNNKASTFKKENNVYTFVVLGLFIERKGQDILLKAIGSINDTSNIRFLFVGQSGGSQYALDIMNKISKIDCCEYLGEKSREEIWEIYREVDAVIVPSLEETLSLVAIEAMIMEKVCIVSNHCGIAELIEDGKSGFIFPLKEVNKLVEIIEFCINNRKECKSIAKNARAIYEKHFSRERFMEQIKGILN